MRHAVRDAKGRFCRTIKDDATQELALGYAVGYKMFRESYFGAGKKYNVGDIITEFPEDIYHDKFSIYFYKDARKCITTSGLVSAAGDLGVLCKVTALEPAYKRHNAACKTSKLRIDEVVDFRRVMDRDGRRDVHKIAEGTWCYTYQDKDAYNCFVNYGGDVASIGYGVIQVSTNWRSNNYIGGGNSISVATEEDSQITSKGNNNILVALGCNSRARGKKGNLLVLVEYGLGGVIEAGLAVVVDGKKVKEDTWYTIKDGKLVKADA